MGFLRVGFLVGPGVGCALLVVAAGLLLGQRAMWVAFALTILAMAGRDVRYLGKPFTGRALVDAVAESLDTTQHPS